MKPVLFASTKKQRLFLNAPILLEMILLRQSLLVAKWAALHALALFASMKKQRLFL